ncbi:MAG: AAA family ATPase, partial [Candidatus Kerfeldbacteria bacterium]|nr:AAA family ATPase [Candidatus Kerfeldbacteria bacterium]
MYLEKLDIQGFKSFAVKSNLEFRTGITAIVGPNGSGKSNVADAIRWVLGEQSLKTIRGKKAEDVIFAGSDKKTKLGAAEVSLYLNNEDGQAPIDFSEVVITRRVYRDGTGEYLINKRAVRLQDIQMLLAKSNFGQRTYSVIGQGMVDQILVTSPQERKHFFDEAAGVRQYQLKREQTVSKLDSTRDNLRQAEILMQEIEPRLRSLTRQVRRLERRAEVEKELFGLQSVYYRGLLHDLRTQLGATNAKLTSFEAERQSRDAAVTKLNGQLASREGEQTRSEAFANLQRQYERIQAEKGVLLAEEAVLKGQRDMAFTQQGKTNVVWLEKQLHSLQQQLQDLSGQEESLESALKLEQSKERALMTEEEQSRKEYERLDAELRKVHAALQAGAVTLPDVQGEFQDFLTFEQAFIGELKGATTLEQLDGLRRRGDELENRTRRLAERLQRLGANDDASNLVELQDALQRTLTARDTAVRALSDLQLAIRLKTEKRSLIAADRGRLNDEIARIERELARSKA